MRLATSRKLFLFTLCMVSVICISMLSACSGGTATAKEGDTVKVLYIGTFDNGSVFQSSADFNNTPFQFTIGANQSIPGFDRAVIGMAVNETKKVHLSVNESYGPYYPELVMTLNRSDIEGGEAIELGSTIILTNSFGDELRSRVINISVDSVTVDANHQLAGQELNFEITLVEIVSAE